MQIGSANKGGGDEGFVLQKRQKKISDCLEIVLEKEKYEIPPFTCQSGPMGWPVPAKKSFICLSEHRPIGICSCWPSACLRACKQA